MNENMYEIDLDFKNEVVNIELPKGFQGTVFMKIYEGDTPREMKPTDMLSIRIRREATLSSNIMSSYNEEIEGFKVPVKSALTADIGEMLAFVGIINREDETEDMHFAKWIVVEGEEA